MLRFGCGLISVSPRDIWGSNLGPSFRLSPSLFTEGFRVIEDRNQVALRLFADRCERINIFGYPGKVF